MGINKEKTTIDPPLRLTDLNSAVIQVPESTDGKVTILVVNRGFT